MRERERERQIQIERQRLRHIDRERTCMCDRQTDRQNRPTDRTHIYTEQTERHIFCQTRENQMETKRRNRMIEKDTGG